MIMIEHVYTPRDGDKTSRFVPLTPLLCERLVARRCGVFLGEAGDRWLPLQDAEAVRAALTDGDTVHTERGAYRRTDEV